MQCRLLQQKRLKHSVSAVHYSVRKEYSGGANMEICNKGTAISTDSGTRGGWGWLVSIVMKNGFCLKVSVDLRCGYYSYRILPPPPFPCGLRHQLSYTRNLKIVNGNDVSCRQMDVWLDECMSNWMDGWLVGWLFGNDEHFIEYLYVCNSSFMVFLFMFFLLQFQSTSLMA